MSVMIEAVGPKLQEEASSHIQSPDSPLRVGKCLVGAGDGSCIVLEPAAEGGGIGQPTGSC